MQIDWWTFIAQIINLVILLFLLRRFLYLPVLKAVEARQKLIKGELKKAADAHREAERISADYQKQIKKIESRRQEILQQTQIEAENLRSKLTAAAEEQYKKSQAEWQRRLVAEQKTLNAAIQQLIVEHFIGFSNKALRQMADISLNNLVIERFMHELQSLSAARQKQLAADFKHKKVLTVQTAPELEAQQQQKVGEFLLRQLQLPPTTRIDFTLNPDLICGIAVQSEEQAISWNLADYLQEFKQKMSKEMLNLIKES